MSGTTNENEWERMRASIIEWFYVSKLNNLFPVECYSIFYAMYNY